MGFGIRPSSLAALPLIRTGYVTSDVIPVQYRISRIPQPFQGYGEIVEVLQISFYRLPNKIDAASVELLGGSIQGSHEGIRQSCGNLAHGCSPP
jgi:hypothetical protein